MCFIIGCFYAPTSSVSDDDNYSIDEQRRKAGRSAALTVLHIETPYRISKYGISIDILRWNLAVIIYRKT